MMEQPNLTTIQPGTLTNEPQKAQEAQNFKENSFMTFVPFVAS
jgi:hypothetical protein